MEQLLSNLNKIIELSGSMLDVARRGDWEQVQVLEQQRKKIFDLTFPLDTDSISDMLAVTRQVQTIADLDRETMRLVAEGGKELSGLAGELSAGRHAVSAYRAIQGK